MKEHKIPVAIINPEAPAESLEAKQPDIDNGTPAEDITNYFYSHFSSSISRILTFNRV